MNTYSKLRCSFFLLTFFCELLVPCFGKPQQITGTTYPTVSADLSLLPVPQKVSLTGKSFVLDNNWDLDPENNLPPDNPAVQNLIAGLKERSKLVLNSKKSDKNVIDRHLIKLIVRPGSVVISQLNDTTQLALVNQAYILKLNASGIEIDANAEAGLFYGIQTMLQLIRTEKGRQFMPEGEITDWPDLELRMIYWDCAHHLDRLPALKRAIKEAAYFKINAFALKLEGHFQFKSAGPIVEPYSLTPAEYQELTDYAQSNFVQLIPYLDAPAHVSFILKHPEYKGLRALPNSNYEFSVTDPKAFELISDLFNDLIEANKGGQYILLSTDEAYYVGKTEKEKEAAAVSGSNGKLLADFISRISGKLSEKGRTVIFWGEYPLTAEDIHSLPSNLITGEYNKSWSQEYKQQGIRQLIYTSTQGVEPLFPNYYIPIDKTHSPAVVASDPADDELQQPDGSKGRVNELLKNIYDCTSGGKSDIMGVIVAGWGDSGLHPETFWLGYASGLAAAWNLKPASAGELTDRFFISFYGTGIFNMNRVYQLLSIQAEYWNTSWDLKPSKLRTPIIGNSQGIYNIPKSASDQTLPFLPVPSAKDLSISKDWSTGNMSRLEPVKGLMAESDELIELLNRNIRDVNYQQYNLQVMLSVALLCRHNLNMLLDLQRIDKYLKLASNVASGNPAAAVSLLDKAVDQVKVIRDQRNESLRSLTNLWYHDWYPVVPEANGRKYLSIVDDIKDHLPVRTSDMSYLIYRELHYPLGKWAIDVMNARNQFAKENHLPLRSETIDWEKY